MVPPNSDSGKEKKATLVIFDREIGINAYVENLIQQLVFALVSTLRAPKLKGTEKVRIEIFD
jgi:hypothetical protein